MMKQQQNIKIICFIGMAAIGIFVGYDHDIDVYQIITPVYFSCLYMFSGGGAYETHEA